MGEEISTSEFTSEDYRRFSARLGENLQALEQLMQRPGFGLGSASIGSELEMYIVDADGHPLGINTDILAAADDPQLTLELNRYNIEYNLTPHAIDAQPLLQSEREICTQLTKLNALAATHGGRVVPIGILPTLSQSDFGPHSMTDRQRYHALVKALIQRRGRQFDIRIRGADQLHLAMEDITLEGANTSFQLHYRVDPAKFADTYNAILLATPLAIAAGANSPTLFGKRLWRETRIPLFKQSIDTRVRNARHAGEPARVNFGVDWLQGGALELFRDTVRMYPPLLPICEDENSLAVVAAGGTPRLAELRMHQSTVWWWNRPVYDPAGDGHLRIEMRALPAGPSAVDTIANAALLLGLMAHFRSRIGEMTAALPFRNAEHNFYRAAQSGLAANLIWPFGDGVKPGIQTAHDILQALMPAIRQGLQQIDICDREIDRYMGVIEHRVDRCQNGATWQLEQLAALEHNMPGERALAAMLERYISLSRGNTPVADWPIET